MHYYADGENPYKLIADELVPGPVGFDKNWASKHTISVLKERDDITPEFGSEPIDICKSRKDEAEKDALRPVSYTHLSAKLWKHFIYCGLMSHKL